MPSNLYNQYIYKNGSWYKIGTSSESVTYSISYAGDTLTLTGSDGTTSTATITSGSGSDLQSISVNGTAVIIDAQGNANIVVPIAATSTPIMDGTGAIGSSTKYAKEDHVHPSDTSKVDVQSIVNVDNETYYGYFLNDITSGMVGIASADAEVYSPVVNKLSQIFVLPGDFLISGMLDNTMFQIEGSNSGNIPAIRISASDGTNNNMIVISPTDTYIPNIVTPTDDSDAVPKSYVDNLISTKADIATTLSGYGITDASISNRTITLGSNTITVPENMVILSYGNSTWNDFISVYNTNRVVYCRASSNSNPATGSQTRLAFMAYVNNGDSPTEVEFQYYRSVSSHSASQQGDQVFVYKLTSSGTWTVTTREAYSKIAVTSPVSSSYSNGTITLSLADAYGDTQNPYGTKTANYVLAGPTSGSASAPSFRALVADDIPILTASKISDISLSNGTITIGSNSITPLTSAPVTSVNNKTGVVSLSASDVGAIATSAKGAASGVAELDANGLVPSSQLPSYVDDVLEYANKSSFPATGETGKIYVDLATNLTYRWSGTAYVEISPSLALGTTSSTAFRGDYGNTAYTHATDSSRLTTATASGLYKIASTSEGHIASLTAVTASDIPDLSSIYLTSETYTGTVTSVRVQATSPVQSSTSTAQSTSLNTIISLADAYGDTKNPYGTKTKNYVLAGPTTGSNAVPSFRALVAGDIPDLSGTYAPKATTLSGYGITDAYISNGTITLGSNSITPVTSSALADYIASDEIGKVYVSDTEPSNTSNYDIWIDTSSNLINANGVMV